MHKSRQMYHGNNSSSLWQGRGRYTHIPRITEIDNRSTLPPSMAFNNHDSKQGKGNFKTPSSNHTENQLGNLPLITVTNGNSLPSPTKKDEQNMKFKLPKPAEARLNTDLPILPVVVKKCAKDDEIFQRNNVVDIVPIKQTTRKKISPVVPGPTKIRENKFKPVENRGHAKNSDLVSTLPSSIKEEIESLTSSSDEDIENIPKTIKRNTLYKSSTFETMAKSTKPPKHPPSNDVPENNPTNMIGNAQIKGDKSLLVKKTNSENTRRLVSKTSLAHVTEKLKSDQQKRKAVKIVEETSKTHLYTSTKKFNNANNFPNRSQSENVLRSNSGHNRIKKLSHEIKYGKFKKVQQTPNNRMTMSCTSLRHFQQEPCVWKLNDLKKFRRTLSVYANSSAHTTRRENFYKQLEHVQMTSLKQRQIEEERKRMRMHQSKLKQMQQLCELRKKQEKSRNSRLSSQHVKWKFVMGVQSDRSQYGLPSELESYRFIPTRKYDPPKRQQSKREMMDRGSFSRILRERNEKRFDHLFQIQNFNRLKNIVPSAIKSGRYVVDLGVGNAKTQNKQKSVVAKHVVEIATKIANANNEYSDDFETDED